MTAPLVEVQNLKTYFYVDQATRKAVDDVSFSIDRGEILCIVGESGCGKSVTALSLMRLIQEPGCIVGGEIRFAGQNLLALKHAKMRNLRGNEIAMIFQEPITSLNSVFTVGQQLMEPLIEHRLLSKKAAYQRAIELIRLVGLPRAEEIVAAYPHELSGGMLQRIMIAMALSCEPKLLIADEPTTALDVTIQAQILALLRQINLEFQMSLLLITHDLGVVAEIADRVIVMYAGKVIEEASVLELFHNPKHPYTQGLLRSKPVIGQRVKRLYSIPGQVPNLMELKESCYFSERCPHRREICQTSAPQLISEPIGHKTACYLYQQGVFQ